MQSILSIPFKGSPELSEAFMGKKPGERCTVCVTIQVNQNDETGLSGTVEEAAPMPGDYKSKEDDGKSSPVKPMTTTGKHSPKMMPIEPRSEEMESHYR